MKTSQEIHNKIYELQNNLSNKSIIQIEILNWVLEKSNTCFVSTEELQKDGINIEFG